MTQLFLNKEKIDSVFQLLGTKEDDITYSIGYALSNSLEFLTSFVLSIYDKAIINDSLKITLQKSESGNGRTDIEIEAENFHFILEAKRGYWLPDVQQLFRYSLRFRSSPRKLCKIIVLTECFPDFAKKILPKTVNNYPVDYRSWRQIYELTQNLKAVKKKQIFVSELKKYLGGIISMQKQESNLVYVVSLSKNTFVKDLSFIDVVKDKNIYFHPLGGKAGWPTEPPNYIGFRYNGKLQSIRHIEEYAITDIPHIKEYAITDTPDDRSIFSKKINNNTMNDLHYLYWLGNPIKPLQEVKTGKIWPSGRVWASLDLLLTSHTIFEARDKTKVRMGWE